MRGVGQVFLSIKEVVNVEWQIGCSLGDSPYQVVLVTRRLLQLTFGDSIALNP